MKNAHNIKIKYDPDADVLSASRGKINTVDHAEEMGDIILHVNPKNEPVLVEILNASHMFHKNMHPKQKPSARRYTKSVFFSSRRKKLAAA